MSGMSPTPGTCERMLVMSSRNRPPMTMVFGVKDKAMLERVKPGRELPHVPGWYARALGVNAAFLSDEAGHA